MDDHDALVEHAAVAAKTSAFAIAPSSRCWIEARDSRREGRIACLRPTSAPRIAAAAWGFAWRLQVAALAALVHAVLPFLCVKTASTLITGLHGRMVTHRQSPARGDIPVAVAAE